MKRLFLILLTLIFCFATVIPPEFSVPFISPSVTIEMPATEEMKPNYEDDRDYKGFAGRLYVDSVGIDVALYRSNKQYVVDREDSAVYFDLARWEGHMIIGDHNNQGFDVISDIEVGTIATIVNADGTVTYYECVEAFNGHNNGRYISDWDGKIVMQRADLLMYTCLDCSRNVRVVLWNKVECITESY